MTTADKQDIATAITNKGVAASVNDSNTVLAQKIQQIFQSTREAIQIGPIGGDFLYSDTAILFTIPSGGRYVEYIADNIQTDLQRGIYAYTFTWSTGAEPEAEVGLWASTRRVAFLLGWKGASGNVQP
ncbi:hypothetical protein GNF85_23800, partial [Clostridium perfringens]